MPTASLHLSESGASSRPAWSPTKATVPHYALPFMIKSDPICFRPGDETVEEYLARGGEIKHLQPGTLVGARYNTVSVGDYSHNAQAVHRVRNYS